MQCTKCGGKMRVVTVIQLPAETVRNVVCKACGWKSATVETHGWQNKNNEPEKKPVKLTAKTDPEYQAWLARWRASHVAWQLTGKFKHEPLDYEVWRDDHELRAQMDARIIAREAAQAAQRAARAKAPPVDPAYQAVLDRADAYLAEQEKNSVHDAQEEEDDHEPS